MPPALRLSGIRKSFGGVVALDGVYLTVERETVRAVLGETGHEGTAVVYRTTDPDELLQIADRVVVVFDGRLREVNCDRHVVGQAMLIAA